MEKHSILNWCSLNLCFVLLLLLLFLGCYHYSSAQPLPYNSFTISSFSYPQTKLKPYDWLYIRVDLPPWFSSMSVVLDSDVNLGHGEVEKIPKSRLPLICFRDGSPPLPDSSNKALSHLVLESLSNGSVEAVEGVLNAELCFPLEKRVTLQLTNEQITPGVLYAGLFNGVGTMRTQSKMITRGRSYTFSANVSVEGCIASNFLGQFCNQSIKALSCSQSNAVDSSAKPSTSDLSDGATNYVVSCKNSVEDACIGDNETRFYSLEIIGMVEKLTISATVKPNITSSDKAGKTALMCYVRYGAIALANMHDFSGDISRGSIIVQLPKIGRWYITIARVNLSNGFDVAQEGVKRICYSLAWQITECPLGKAGFNCTAEMHILQTVLRKNPSVPFESYYLPLDEKVSFGSANFPLEPLLSNSTFGKNLGITWTYFVIDVPTGAGGGNLHFRLTSDEKAGHEIYLRYGGLPTAEICDFYYVNQTNSSDGSMSFLLYNSTKEMVDFYVLYAREGTWGLGLKHLNLVNSASSDSQQTTISISLERCPKRCFAPHGTCQNFVDESGLTLYSYCACDRTHGGTDCSIELISHRGHMLQSVLLVASNVAAVLPAYWSLRNKAFAEWVIFTSSGISSGLYHACDVGAWCALGFHPLQFMDFWLSFMAVVSTFVYLAAIDESSRRTIHAVVSILTALMAITGATRSSNLVLVIVIGATGLFIGWLIELSTKFRSFSFRGGFCLSEFYSWQSISTSIHNFVKMILKRFHWGFLLAGFIALTMAAVSWKLETYQSYWIWHSLWHVSIYTSSFLFLCSKIRPRAADTENPRPPVGNYQLTRLDSISHPG